MRQRLELPGVPHGSSFYSDRQKRKTAGASQFSEKGFIATNGALLRYHQKPWMPLPERIEAGTMQMDDKKPTLYKGVDGLSSLSFPSALPHRRSSPPVSYLPHFF